MKNSVDGNVSKSEVGPKFWPNEGLDFTREILCRDFCSDVDERDTMLLSFGRNETGDEIFSMPKIQSLHDLVRCKTRNDGLQPDVERVNLWSRRDCGD